MPFSEKHHQATVENMRAESDDQTKWTHQELTEANTVYWSKVT